MRIMNAAKWIAQVDQLREEKHGTVDPRVTVDAAPDAEFDLPTEKVKKRCACGSESKISLPDDGTPYFCRAVACQARRWSARTRKRAEARAAGFATT